MKLKYRIYWGVTFIWLIPVSSWGYVDFRSLNRKIIFQNERPIPKA